MIKCVWSPLRFIYRGVLTCLAYNEERTNSTKKQGTSNDILVTEKLYFLKKKNQLQKFRLRQRRIAKIHSYQ